MKTPWINHSKMKEMSSKQTLVYKSDSKGKNSICGNKKRNQSGNDDREFNTAPRYMNIDEEKIQQKYADVKDSSKLHQQKPTDFIRDLHDLLDGKDSKHVSHIEEPTETDHVFKSADSGDCKQAFKAISSDKPNDTAQTNTVFKSDPDEMHDLLEKEALEGTDPADVQSDTHQTDVVFEHLHPSEPDFMDEVKVLINIEEMEVPDSTDGPNDPTLTAMVPERLHPPEPEFMDEVKVLLDKEEMEAPDSADGLNNTPLTEVVPERLHPPEPIFIEEANNLLDKEEVEAPDSAGGLNNTPLTEVVPELLHPPEPIFIEEANNLLDKEEMEAPDSTDVPYEPTLTEMIPEHLHPPEPEFMDEEKVLIDIEEVHGIYPAEEMDPTFEANATFEPLEPSASEDEMEILLYIEEIDETYPEEDRDSVDYLSYPALTHSASNGEDKMEDLLETEEVKEANNSPGEQDNTSYLHYPVHTYSESDTDEELYDLCATLEVDETYSIEELDLVTNRNSDPERFRSSECDLEDEMMSDQEIEEEHSSNYDGMSEFHKTGQGKVCFITKKSPFSIHVEIDDFLHAPICGEKLQNTFEFFHLDYKHPSQYETKLINTTTDYPEQPDCHLVRSNIHEMIFLTDLSTYENKKNQHYKSIVVPLHDLSLKETKETTTNSYASPDIIHIKVPVVVGEYKIEACLEENLVFEEGILGVNEISKEVILTHCKFAPTQFTQSLGNGTCTASKGNLFIEGTIHQNIEYTAFHNNIPGLKQKKSGTHSNQLCQKIVLELIIHLLQVQKVRVRYDGKDPSR
ncbi:BC_2427 family protein [Heyndrickxia acidicola]|uniref:DUF7852 domain-containing protein n=1 Tax=Heyndrickxia acidicola TaxID=209389 RepID=A0ABU6MEK2_9BACI|nr:hypothetical protein [Heyndrickxia acidicola]MED1203078.1 hypothetical protein [Heyndrickxia acidicola]